MPPANSKPDLSPPDSAAPQLRYEGLDILILRSAVQLDEWQAEWRRLWSAQKGISVFQHFDWATAWINCIGSSGQLSVVIARESTQRERALAILPLWMNEDNEYSLVGEPASDYQDLLCDEGECEIDEVLLAMLTTLINSRPKWKRIMLDEMREDSVLLRSLRRLASSGSLPFTWQEQATSRCPTVLTYGQDEVFDGILKKKSLRRHYNRMSKMQGFQYRRIGSPDEARVVLDALIDQHVARWAINGIPSLFEDQRNIDFYRMLIASPQFFPLIHCSVVQVQDQPVATHIGFLHDKCFVWYKPSFDPNFEKLSPGEVLMSCLFKELKNADVDEFDFTRGEESFKSRFATHVRQNYRFTAFSSSLDRSAYLMIESLRGAEKKNGIIGKLGSFARTIVQGLRRMRAEIDKGGFSFLGSRLKTQLVSTEVKVFVFREGDDEKLDPPIEDLEIDFGEVDLLLLGNLSLLDTKYLTPAMLSTAARRRKQGDRILIVRNSAGQAIHFSWLCKRELQEALAIAQTGRATGERETVNIIADPWTSNIKQRAELSAWALQKLAIDSVREGRSPYFFCDPADIRFRRAAKKAGFQQTD